MTESDKERAERVGEAKVAAAYRSLRAEEPPRALDDAILAAARRPQRPWTQRWAVPLSLAAVVVLSVVVTLQVQLEQPGIDGLQAPPSARPAREPEQPLPLKLKAEEQLKLAAKPPAKAEVRRAEPKPFADAKAERARESVAAVTPAPAAPSALGSAASRGDAGRGEDLRYGDSALRREEERVARDAEAAARAPQVGAALAKQRSAPEPAARVAAAPPAAPGPAGAAASAAKPATEPALQTASEQAGKLSGETPEQEFERIARLRAEGRHDEADKAFLEFRRRYPNFRITEEMLRRVERR